MLIVAGAGPGSLELLTVEVLDLIKSSKKVMAFGRIASSFYGLRGDIITVSRVDEVITQLAYEEDILLLASGDPCFFGIIELIKNRGITIDRIVPGISSMQYMMSKLQIPWKDFEFVSFHGRAFDLSKIKGDKLFFFTDKDNTPNHISKQLFENGYKGEIIAGFNLSYDDEEIISVKIGDDIKDIDKVSVAVVMIDESA